MELIFALPFDEQLPELLHAIVKLAAQHGKKVELIGVKNDQIENNQIEDHEKIMSVKPYFDMKNTMMTLSVNAHNNPGIGNAVKRLIAKQFQSEQILIVGCSPYSRGFADSNIFIERIEAHCELATLSDLNLKSNRKISAVKKIPFPAQCKAAKRNYFPGMRRK